jgi:hypothetical protein
MANNSNVTEACSLPPNKRYICTHNSSGKSIVHSSPPQVFHPFGAMAGARSYATSTVPAVLKGDVDVSAYLATEGATSHMGTDIVVPTGKGANLIAIDLPPGSQSGMHRTVSIDYSICVIGHVCMELDGGETLELRPGVRIVSIMRDSLGKRTRANCVAGPCYPAGDDAQMVQWIAD